MKIAPVLIINKCTVNINKKEEGFVLPESNVSGAAGMLSQVALVATITAVY